ncbi:hypothetical protein [Streptomyces sp. URMC 123]|uniref:hypothetical protein n=1 Tax=Streptomyces sp. URMC 123 TaxID=3423403 RepID=UPI003F1AF293
MRSPKFVAAAALSAALLGTGAVFGVSGGGDDDKDDLAGGIEVVHVHDVNVHHIPVSVGAVGGKAESTNK